METEDRTPGYYAVIPAEVLNDKDLPPNAKLLFGYISALSNSKGYCFASNAYFAERFGSSSRSVSAWVSALNDLGYVDVEIDTKGIEPRKIYMTGARRNLLGGAKKSAGGREEIFVHNIKDNTKVNKKTLKTSSTVVDGDVLFNRFWASYPKKVGKKDAVKAFKKLNPSLTLLQIIEGNIMSRKNIGTPTGFWPNPATYLNGERWTDEITERHNANHRQGTQRLSAPEQVRAAIAERNRKREAESRSDGSVVATYD